MIIVKLQQYLDTLGEWAAARQMNLILPNVKILQLPTDEHPSTQHTGLITAPSRKWHLLNTWELSLIVISLGQTTL